MSAAEARAIAAKIIADVKTGRRHKLITPQERQFENFGRLFFTRYRHNWKPVTLAGSQRVFNDYLVPWFAGHAVDHISPADVQRWFAALRDKPGAANRSLALLSVMMREAERCVELSSETAKHLSKHTSLEMMYETGPAPLLRAKRCLLPAFL
jgi:hypothetical protein